MRAAMSAVADLHAADRPKRFGIVGAGLIGGSIAKAIAAADGDSAILVHDIEERNRIDLAGAVPSARAIAELADLAGCECVFVCTPVSAIAGTVRSVAALVGPDSTIIDCGSVKNSILRELEAQGAPIANYVPGHPMSGGNSSGPALSSAAIIAGSPFVLCPGPNTDAKAVARAEEILRGLGALPLRVRARDHDRAVALTSHLPHLLAFALMASLDRDGPAEPGLVAGSFRSVTRFATGDSSIWTDIFRANRSELLDALRGFEIELGHLRALIGDRDLEPLESRLAALARRRRALDGQGGEP